MARISGLFIAIERGAKLTHAAYVEAARGVHVADRHMAFASQRAVAQVVLLQVHPHVAVAPVGERAQLSAAVVQSQERRVGAAAHCAPRIHPLMNDIRRPPR
jgi:hypothetical protein